MTRDRSRERCFCPHCGFNLVADEVVTLDGFTIDPRGTVTFDGRRVMLSPAQATIFHTIATASGRQVSFEALLERTGSDADAVCIRTQICHIRRRLKNAGAPDPITSQWGMGYAWDCPSMAVAA